MRLNFEQTLRKDRDSFFPQKGILSQRYEKALAEGNPTEVVTKIRPELIYHPLRSPPVLARSDF